MKIKSYFDFKRKKIFKTQAVLKKFNAGTKLGGD